MSKLQSGLSQGEWELMRICWEQGEVPARYIYDAALKHKQRKYVTIKTMLERMTAKGYLSRRRLGAIWLFKPAVPQKRALARAIDHFMETVMGNQISPLLSHYVKKEKLSPEDLAQLKELIRKSEEK